MRTSQPATQPDFSIRYDNAPSAPDLRPIPASEPRLQSALDAHTLKRDRENPMHVHIRLNRFAPAPFAHLARFHPDMLHQPNRVQATPLHVAAEAGDIEAITWLVRAGADINAKQIAGYTALLIAAHNNQRAAVRCLLNHGADPAIASRYNGGFVHAVGIDACDIHQQEPWLAAALVRSRQKPKRRAYIDALEEAMLCGCDI